MSQPIAAHAAPIAFEPDMEVMDMDEAGTGAKLETTLASIREKTFADHGHAHRSVHAKAHGLLHATLTIADALPPSLAQGMFAKPGQYRVLMRFSTLPGDILSDDVSTPRGLAIKIIGVEGERLEGSEGESTQDFLMVNGPAFGAPTAKKFAGLLGLLAKTTDRFEGAKRILSHIARACEALLETFGKKSALLITAGGQPATHILGETFYTQTPFLYGRYYAKLSVRPSAPSLTALKDKPVDVEQDPNGLRAAVVRHFDSEGGEWALEVQLATDPAAMPIEDASAVWPEDHSPYITVGHLSAPPQQAWSVENQRLIDDGLSFSPWHGLAAHRPLGGVNRARKATYRSSAGFRGKHTGCPMHEPAAEIHA